MTAGRRRGRRWDGGSRCRAPVRTTVISVGISVGENQEDDQEKDQEDDQAKDDEEDQEVQRRERADGGRWREAWEEGVGDQ